MPAYALSPNGRSLAVAHPDGAVGLVDVETLRTLSKPIRVTSGRPVTAMRFLPDGRMLAIAGSDGRIVLVDARTGEEVTRPAGERSAIWGLSFSADGRLMATLSDDGARVRRLPSGRAVGPPVDRVVALSLRPDGRTLVVAALNRVELIDVASHRRRSLLTHETVDVAQLTTDGRFLLLESQQGRLRLWSADSGKPVTGTLGGHRGDVTTASVSPNGRTVATGSTDGTIRLWDRSTNQPIGAPLPGIPNRPVIPEFTPDGAYLLAITNTGRAFRWDVRPSSWARHACHIASRTLTPAEWSDALPDREYAPACSR